MLLQKTHFSFSFLLYLFKAEFFTECIDAMLAPLLYGEVGLEQLFVFMCVIDETRCTQQHVRGGNFTAMYAYH